MFLSFELSWPIRDDQYIFFSLFCFWLSVSKIPLCYLLLVALFELFEELHLSLIFAACLTIRTRFHATVRYSERPYWIHRIP